MTYKERWEKDNRGKKFNPYSTLCPSGYGYEIGKEGQFCSNPGLSCIECWGREIPEDEPNTDVKMEAVTPSIKDSGDRTQFETGAVRDMREGKGRCDLMPLEVVAQMCHRRQPKNYVLAHIANFKVFNDTTYLYMALEDCGIFSGLETMFLEVAKHFEEGAKKYGENNWQKGIPVHCYIDSAVRHYLKWLRGDNDEPHDRAFVWNIMCCIWEVDYHKETSDNKSCVRYSGGRYDDSQTS